MTQEEKAKRFDEALKEAKEVIEYYKEHNRGDEASIEDLEGIFPELAESEDERIRKELIEHVKANREEGFVLFQKFLPDDIIAWLEKQGEQKPKWSEEDEENIQHCCGAVAAADYYTMEDKEELANWLISLKQRMEDKR